MSSDAGGPDDAASSPPTDPFPAYAPAPPGPQPAMAYPGYPPPGYPPPGYAPPGYPPPSGYYPPQGYPGYPGYPPFAPAAALKPGVIPLRPLGLSDIFNASVAYIRTNPKATLGLTTIVVVVAQIAALLLQIGPLAASGVLTPPTPGTFGQSGASEISGSTMVGLMLSGLAGVVTTPWPGSCSAACSPWWSDAPCSAQRSASAKHGNGFEGASCRCSASLRSRRSAPRC